MLFAARYGLQGLDSPVHFHYVAPSFWAWKGGEERLKGLTAFVDHIFCILPNEEVVCKSHGLEATFVGHPIIEDILKLESGKQTSPREWKIEGNCEDFRSKFSIPSGATVISLLPGSRLQEVSRMLSIFANAIEQLEASFPQLITIIHVAPNQHVENYVSQVVRNWPVPAVLIQGGNTRLKYDAFSASGVALCTSGTVALELQLARTPCLVAYRAHILTEWVIKYKARMPYISLPNILLDSAIIPEALFQACTPSNLASILMELIHNKGLQEEQIVTAEKVTSLLFPTERTINNLGKPDGMVSANCTPSKIAASTILCHVKPN